MTIELWVAFVIAASIILMIPGPTILFEVMQSLVHGRKASGRLVAGVVTGDAICITLSLLGLSALLALSATLFALLKFIGSAYLIWLGLDMLRKGFKPAQETKNVAYPSRRSLFAKVMAISALNPKGIIFYSAFMPQFVNESATIPPQLLLLATTFLSLTTLNALFYSLLASKVASFFHDPLRRRWINYSGGVTLIGAGAITASSQHL